MQALFKQTAEKLGLNATRWNEEEYPQSTFERPAMPPQEATSKGHEGQLALFAR